MAGLRARPPGIEWKTGRNPKMGKKIGQKIKNGPRPEMGKKWPKNGEKIEKWPQIPFFSAFLGHFSHFGPRAIFYFLANFFPFLDFGPFSILYQAAWLVMAGGYGLAFFRALNLPILEPQAAAVWQKSLLLRNSSDFLASEKLFSDSGKWPFHTPPIHTTTKRWPT